MEEGISLLGGQIVIPASITLPLPVVIGMALLAIVGCITLFCLWMAAESHSPW